MENSKLFLPQKCKVGFNIREDCYTKRLGYIIFYDGTKWRKEASWESWRQKEDQPKQRVYDYQVKKYIDNGETYGEDVRPIEFDNVPTSGFVLNKKVGGYRSSWNMRQTYARVYDPRGFEFEINIVNLLYILEVCNCMRGKGLEGEFVYSWDGKDLVLLPCSSWEFEKASVFTNLQDKKVSTKDLIPGASYKTKREEDIIYIGHYKWFELDRYRKDKSRAGKKYHIFTGDNGETFLLKSGAQDIAIANTTEPVSEFASIIEKFQNNTHSSKIVKFEVIPAAFDTTLEKFNNGYGREELVEKVYFKLDGNFLIQYRISAIFDDKVEYDSSRNYIRKSEFKGYTYQKEIKLDIISQTIIGILDSEQNGRRYNIGWGRYGNNYESTTNSKEQIEALSLGDLFVTLENGKRIQVGGEYSNNIYSI